MRTLALNFEVDTIALACGAPGHVLSAVFDVNSIETLLDGLTELFLAYKPQRVLLNGDRSPAMADIETWLADRGHAFTRMPEGAVTEMTDALTTGAADLDIVDGPALFENCRPGEDRALAALELDHRLVEWSADQLRQSGAYV